MNLKNLINESLPTYMFDLPYSGGKVKFRPFLVKEEKKLLILEETSSQKEVYNGIVEILNSCFENTNFENLPIFEVDYCFLKLRSKSVGEIINPKINCPETKENHIVNIDLNNLEFKNTKSKNIIDVGNSVKIYLKYPTVKDMIDESDDINDLIANCILYFEDKEEKVESSNFTKEEILDFINHLTISQYNKIIEFFNNMPSVEVEASYQTSDGVNRTVKFRRLKDFFI